MGNPPRYRRKGPYCVLSFLLLFCVFCGVISKSVLESVLSIISAAGLRKKKPKQRNKQGSTVRVKIIISLLRAVVEN